MRRIEATHIESVVQVEIVMTIEVATHEFVNFGLTSSMQVLEFMHGLEFDNIQAIWHDAIWFPFQ